MRALALILLVTGCKWVADSQYDDRADELEESRSEFLPAADQIQLLTATENRLYWISRLKPLEEPMLHSYEPASGTRTDYEITRGNFDLEDEFIFGDELFAECAFSSATAYDARTGAMLGETNMGGSTCAVAGRFVYFVVGGKVRRWAPGQGEPIEVLDLLARGVGDASSEGFGVTGNQMVYVEGGRAWLVDLSAGTATWLENEAPVRGFVVFDDKGVLYDSSNGVQYVAFADHATFPLDAAIADGGYRMSSQYGDIHEIAGDGAYTLYGRHVVYRSVRGIFAYGLDTKKVVDLLLDRGESFDTQPHYVFPSVTANGSLFVLDKPLLSSDAEGAVYRVELGDRLR